MSTETQAREVEMEDYCYLLSGDGRIRYRDGGLVDLELENAVRTAVDFQRRIAELEEERERVRELLKDFEARASDWKKNPRVSGDVGEVASLFCDLLRARVGP